MSTITNTDTEVNTERGSQPLRRGEHSVPRITAPNDHDGDEPQETPAASAAGTPLIMELQGQAQTVVVAALQNAEYIQQVRDQIRAAGEAPIFDLRHLLDWTAGDRWAVLGFIAGLDTAYTVRHAEFGEAGDLFLAVLNAMVGDEDVARCGRGVRAAIEAAAMLHHHPQALPAACGRIAQRLADLGVDGYTAYRLQQQAEQLAAEATVQASSGEQAVVRVQTNLPDAPVPGQAVVPEGWLLSAEGIAKGTADNAVVTIPEPMVITRRFTEVDGDAEHLGVAWPRDGRWHEEIVTRLTIAGQRTVIDLAAHGAPVTSTNASTVVDYLAAFETYNLEILPRSRVARQLGWQGAGGGDGFLWGERLLRDNCDTVTPPASADVAPATPQASDIIFRGADEGDGQLAAGYCDGGSFEDWCAAVQPIAQFPKVILGIYAALAPPMLEILNSDNFIVSYAGATSQGKTITLRIAASCWGCPNEKSTTAAIGTWDATRVWFGRAPAVLNHLPLVVDDTKRASKKEIIAQMIYDVASGRGRGRGSVQGLARNDAFRTVMITSGEAPITSFSEDGGTRARVLELWASPFGRADGATAQIVNRINDRVHDHYGHLGPRFVQYLLENRERWADWREQYRQLRQQFADRAGDNSVAARMATHLAAIGMTARLVHEAVEMPWPYRDVVGALWADLTAETPEADRAAVALRHVLSWAHGHREQFHPHFNSSSMTPPSGGWAGRWALDEKDEPYVGFLPHKLNEILQAGGFEPEPIKRLWLDRGWLKVSKGKHQYRTRMGNELPYVVAIKRTAIEQVEGPADANEDGPPRQRMFGGV